MTTVQTETLLPSGVLAGGEAAMTGANRRTLETIFRHPLSHNLEWRAVVALLETIGEVEQTPNSEFSLRIGNQHHLMRRPHDKDLTATQVIDLRRFLVRAGLSPRTLRATLAPTAPNLIVAVDHHEARIYEIDVASSDESKHLIKPYDPHHFLHHLMHKDQSREQGQRAPEDPSFYQRIAQAMEGVGRIVVVGHGEGKSNAAHHLVEYLDAHHPDTYRRIVGELVADLSSLTPPQLLEMGRQALR